MRRAVAVALVAAVLAASGCAGGGRKKRRPPRPSGEEQYRAALALMEKKRYTKARLMLGEIGVRELQDSTLDPLVKIALADAYYLDGGITNIIEAQARYEQFIAFYPSHERAPYAQYQLGRCHFDQSAEPYNDQEFTRKAMAEFEKVRELDPDSEYVVRAEEMIQQCREKLARHEFDVGRFYFRRRACAAAAGRFRRVLSEYPRFSETDGAYYYLGESLVCLNNREEGRIYLEKLVHDFPESDYAAKVKEATAGRPG